MKKIYEGNLIVSSNETLVVDYTEITGYVDVRQGATLQVDALTTIGGYVYVEQGATLQVDALTTIGGDVYVSEVATLQADALSTIGGYVYVRQGATLQADALTTIGGSVYVNQGATLAPTGLQGNNPAAKDIRNKIQRNGFVTPDGKYIIADRILSKIVSHHANVYKIKHIIRAEVQFLITDGNGNYAHGPTIEEAREDLIFKITDRKKSDYEGLRGNDVLSYADAVRCYRVVTGACSAGTRSFVENVLGSKKSEYSIKEIGKLTKGQYGNESFCKFFNVKSL